MVPVGYMAKKVVPPPGWLSAPNVEDVCSVTQCVNDDVIDPFEYGATNVYGCYDSPLEIQRIATENAISLQGSSLFFYEVYEEQCDELGWSEIVFGKHAELDLSSSTGKNFLGFDIVTFDRYPEHSPLSCNSIAEDIPVNRHCLFDTLNEARKALDDGAFDEGEDGPYRIYSVYLATWPTPA